MKKSRYIFVYMMISLLLLIGCSNLSKNNSSNWSKTTRDTVNNFTGVSMKISEGTISRKGLIVEFENKSDNLCMYGEEFSLEKKINGKWYSVPVRKKGDYSFSSIGYEVSPNKSSELAVDWNWLYGKIDKGEYRIIKGVLNFRKAGDYDEYSLAAEFKI